MKIQNHSSFRTSIARRLTLGFGGASTVLILLSGTLLYWMLKQQLHAERELLLRDRVVAISRLLKESSYGYTELKEKIEKQWPFRGGEKVFIQIIDGAGKTAFESPTDKIPDPFSQDFQNKKFLIETDRYVENSIGLASPVQLQIAIDDKQSQEFLNVLRDVLIAVFFINVVVSLFVGRFIVRRELFSLQEIIRKISKISSENLQEKITTEALPKELTPLAEAFNFALDRLSDSFKRLSQFSSDIAHELRTPAANIRGSIEVALSRPRSSAEYCDLLESNLEECDRITRITESLLFLARAENLQAQLVVKPLHLKNEIQSLIDFYEPLASEKSIQLQFKNQNSADVVIFADPTLFQRILSNLISNAIRFTSMSGSIEISFKENSRGEIHLSVTDTGPGIAEDEIPRIFERFYRVDASRNPNSGGSGLGLAIVKSIVDLHAAQIEVKSQLGVGSEFILKWPVSTKS
jgi:two-component system heavy metal sensor histidine kinase CusS